MTDRRAVLAGGLAAWLGLTLAPRGLAAALAYPAPDRELMVPVEGGRVYVRVNGRLDGPRPPIVMIHGGPGGTHGFFLPALALAGERAVILYDQLDSGQSDRPNDPKNWRVARFVDELDAIRDALGVKRWHVLGHSWGGTVALEYGARRSPALASLILASPLISTRSWIADADLLRGQLPAEIRAELATCDAAPDAAACIQGTDAYYAEHVERVPRDAAMAAYAGAHPGGFNARLYETMWGRSEFVSTGTLRDYDGEPLLARLDGPRTLFMSGQHDEARPATLAGFAARVPGAEWAVVPGSAHALLIDRPDETVAIVRAWLARHDVLA